VKVRNTDSRRTLVGVPAFDEGELHLLQPSGGATSWRRSRLIESAGMRSAGRQCRRQRGSVRAR